MDATNPGAATNPELRLCCIAHRGFSGRFPENTLAALRGALDLGVDMVELDVTLTADDEVVVLHDQTLDRTTDGRGFVREQRWSEIAGLDAGSWFSPEFAGERIPTLVQALELVRGRALLNIEIKKEAVTDRIEGGVTERVIDHVRATDMRAEVILSSYDPRAVAQARAIEPGIRRASLYNQKIHRGMSPTEVMDQVGAVVFSPSGKQVSPEMIADVHESGRKIMVYTVNREADMRRMIDLGVDGIFTDHPDVLLELIASLL
jgi:glycerophosphoryl diester phosphodiesterase